MNERKPYCKLESQRMYLGKITVRNTDENSSSISCILLAAARASVRHSLKHLNCIGDLRSTIPQTFSNISARLKKR